MNTDPGVNIMCSKLLSTQIGSNITTQHLIRLWRFPSENALAYFGITSLMRKKFDSIDIWWQMPISWNIFLCHWCFCKWAGKFYSQAWCVGVKPRAYLNSALLSITRKHYIRLWRFQSENTLAYFGTTLFMIKKRVFCQYHETFLVVTDAAVNELLRFYSQV